jgi:hypothetical protein
MYLRPKGAVDTALVFGEFQLLAPVKTEIAKSAIWIPLILISLFILPARGLTLTLNTVDVSLLSVGTHVRRKTLQSRICTPSACSKCCVCGTSRLSECLWPASPFVSPISASCLTVSRGRTELGAERSRAQSNQN